MNYKRIFYVFAAVFTAVFLTANCTQSAGTADKDKAKTVTVRYIVNDVDAAVKFYEESLGFKADLFQTKGFASLSNGNLRLLLNAPGAGGAGQAMLDGSKPAPGGWNRLQIEVADLSKEVERLRNANAHFRNEIVNGFGGKQILLEDPSGNLIELFEPARKIF